MKTVEYGTVYVGKENKSILTQNYTKHRQDTPPSRDFIWLSSKGRGGPAESCASGHMLWSMTKQTYQFIHMENSILPYSRTKILQRKSISISRALDHTLKPLILFNIWTHLKSSNGLTWKSPSQNVQHSVGCTAWSIDGRKHQRVSMQMAMSGRMSLPIDKMYSFLQWLTSSFGWHDGKTTALWQWMILAICR